MARSTTVTRQYVQPYATQSTLQHTTSLSTLHKRIITPKQHTLIVKALFIWLAFTVGGWQWLPPEFLPIFSHCVGFGFFLQLITGKTRYLGILAVGGVIYSITAYIYIQPEWIVLFGNASGYMAIIIAVLVITLCYNTQQIESIVTNTNVNDILDDIRNEVDHTFKRVKRFVDSMTIVSDIMSDTITGNTDTNENNDTIQPPMAQQQQQQVLTPVNTITNDTNKSVDTDTIDLETQSNSTVPPPIYRRDRSCTDVDLDDVRSLKLLVDQLKDALLVAEQVSLNNKQRIDILEHELHTSKHTVNTLNDQLNTHQQLQYNYTRLQNQLADVLHDKQISDTNNQQLQQQVNQLTDENKSLTYQLRVEGEHCNVQLQISNDKLKQNEKRLNELQQHNTQLNHQYKTLQNTILLSHNDKHQLEQQVKQLRHDKIQLQYAIDELQSENHQLKQQQLVKQQRSVIGAPIHNTTTNEHSTNTLDQINFNQSRTPLHALFGITDSTQPNSLFSTSYDSNRLQHNIATSSNDQPVNWNTLSHTSTGAEKYTDPLHVNNKQSPTSIHNLPPGFE